MITQERVKQVFKYVQGNLYWKINLGSRGKIGVKAGNLNSGGYYIVQVDKVQYYIHRLIYLYHHGYIPKFIDHKHGKSIGNYIWNLRPCTVSENRANSSLNKNNTSGFRGVLLQKSTGKWIARVKYKGVSYQLGTYKDPKNASIAVEKKRKELHGRFFSPIN